MHMYDGYHFGGMHLIWWAAWMILLFWIFATPYDIPGQRRRKPETPLDLLKRRFASSEITADEYNERKKILEATPGTL